MKFLVFSPYYPPHTGGLESHSEEFNKELVKRNHKVTVFTPALPKESPAQEDQDSIYVIRYPAFEIVSNYPLPIFWKKLFWEQLRSLKKIAEPDIVITRTRFFLLSLIGLLFAKKNKLPCVHIEHGSDFVKLSNPLSSLVAYIYDQSLGRLVIKKATLTIAISQAVQKFVQKFDTRMPPVIYRGLNFAGLDAALPKSPPLPERYQNRLIITTVARLYKWKGIERSLRALKELPSELQQKIVFVVIGDGENKHYLQNLARELPVVFLGKVPRKEAVSFLKKADIYIHSSYPGGGLSTSLLEALYCGVAVMATPHEGAAEVITHNENGLLIHENDFTAPLRELIEDKLLRTRLASKAKQTVQDTFSWEKSITQYLTFFEKL